MVVVASVFFFCALVSVVWLRYCGKIGEKWLAGLVVAGMAGILILVLGPDTLKVDIAGSTLTALRQETRQARKALFTLKDLRYDVLLIELKRIQKASRDYFSMSAKATKAEEFDQFMFVFSLLSREERFDEELRPDAVQACEAVLSRQHEMTVMHFVFFDKSNGPRGYGKFLRAGSYSYDDNFRTLTSAEIQAELEELHQKITDTPGQSLENDGNHELRLEAVKNYTQLSDVCATLSHTVAEQTED